MLSHVYAGGTDGEKQAHISTRRESARHKRARREKRTGTRGYVRARGYVHARGYVRICHNAPLHSCLLKWFPGPVAGKSGYTGACISAGCKRRQS